MKFENGRLCVGSSRLSWRIGFGSGKKDEEVRYIGPEDMGVFTPAPNGGIWKNSSGFTVQTEYAEIDGILQGTISFSGNDGVKNPVEEIIFPRAEVELDSDTAILLPVSQGRVVRDLTCSWDEKLTARTAGRYRSFRCTAAYSRGRGIYFDCRDAGFHNKGYTWRKEEGKLIYSHIHYLPLDGRGEFTLPYRCGVTGFEGEWFEAAMIYKKWAVNQVWYKMRCGKKIL